MTVLQDLQQRIGTVHRLVLRIEGIEYDFWEPHSTPPTSDSDGWRTALSCLESGGESSIGLSIKDMEVSPSGATFYLMNIYDENANKVIQANDENITYLLPILFSTENDGLSTHALAPSPSLRYIKPSDTVINCEDNSAFPSSGTAYLGKYRFSYTGKGASNDSFTGVTLGVYPALTSSSFASSTKTAPETGTDGSQAGYPITQYPVNLLGRDVVLYATTLQEDGTWASTSNSEVLFVGNVNIELNYDPSENRYEISCMSILDRLKRKIATESFETIKGFGYNLIGDTYENRFIRVVAEVHDYVLVWDGSTVTNVLGWGSDYTVFYDEIIDLDELRGYYSHTDCNIGASDTIANYRTSFFNKIKSAILHQMTINHASGGLVLSDNPGENAVLANKRIGNLGETKIECDDANPFVDGSKYSINIPRDSYGRSASRFHFLPADVSKGSNHIKAMFGANFVSGIEREMTYYAPYSFHPLDPESCDNKFYFNTPDPKSVSSSQDGVNLYCSVKTLSDSSSNPIQSVTVSLDPSSITTHVDTRGTYYHMTYNDNQSNINTNHLHSHIALREYNPVFFYDDPKKPYKPGDSTVGVFTTLANCLVSTGESAYNGANDILRPDLSLGIPEEYVDIESFRQADAQIENNPLAIRYTGYLAKSPTAWNEIILQEGKLFGYFVSFNNGKIRLKSLMTHKMNSYLVELDDSTTASASSMPIVEMSTDNVINTFIVIPHYDVEEDDFDDFKIEIIDINSHIQTLSKEEIEIEHKGLGGRPDNELSAMLTAHFDQNGWAFNFRYPKKKISTTLNRTLVGMVGIGDIVKYTSTIFPDPSGSGLMHTTMLGIVTDYELSYTELNARVDILLFGKESDIASIPWSPSAMVDSSSYTNGWESTNYMLSLVEHKYGNSSTDNHDGSSFNEDDRIYIIEVNPSDPSTYTPLGPFTVLEYDSGDLYLKNTPSISLNSNTEYTITFADYDLCQQSQKALGLFASDATYRIDGDSGQQYG